MLGNPAVGKVNPRTLQLRRRTMFILRLRRIEEGTPHRARRRTMNSKEFPKLKQLILWANKGSLSLRQRINDPEPAYWFRFTPVGTFPLAHQGDKRGATERKTGHHFRGSSTTLNESGSMRHECETANVMSALCGLWPDKCRDVVNKNAKELQGNKEDRMNNCTRLTLKIQKNSFPWSRVSTQPQLSNLVTQDPETESEEY